MSILGIVAEEDDNDAQAEQVKEPAKKEAKDNKQANQVELDAIKNRLGALEAP